MTQLLITAAATFAVTKQWAAQLYANAPIRALIASYGNAAGKKSADNSSVTLFGEAAQRASELLDDPRGMMPSAEDNFSTMHCGAQKGGVSLERDDPAIPALGLPPDQLDLYFTGLVFSDKILWPHFYEIRLRQLATDAMLARNAVLAAHADALAIAQQAGQPPPAAPVLAPVIDLGAAPWDGFLELCRIRGASLYKYVKTCDQHVLTGLSMAIHKSYAMELMNSISLPTERRADRALQIIQLICERAKSNSGITPLSIISTASTMARSATTADDIAKVFEYLQTHQSYITFDSANSMVNELVKRIHVTMGYRANTAPFDLAAKTNTPFSRLDFVGVIRAYENDQLLYSDRDTSVHPPVPYSNLSPFDLAHGITGRKNPRSNAASAQSPKTPRSSPGASPSAPSEKPPGAPEVGNVHEKGGSGYFMRKAQPRCFGCANISYYYKDNGGWNVYDT